jgi:hypothetical protein
MDTATSADAQFDRWREWVATKQWHAAVNIAEFVPGYYKTKMGKRFVQVAIWRDADGEHMTRDGQYIADLSKRLEIWTYCTVVSGEMYDDLIADKSGDPVYAKLPTDAAGLLSRVKALAAITASIDTPDDAARLADVAHALRAAAKIAEDTQKELVDPLKAQIKRANAIWGEIVEFAEVARAPVMGALERYLGGKNEPAGVKGQLGRAISLRTDKTLEITDYGAALSHFVKAAPEEFSSIVEKLARAALKKGEAVPGAKLVEVKRAQ